MSVIIIVVSSYLHEEWS